MVSFVQVGWQDYNDITVTAIHLMVYKILYLYFLLTDTTPQIDKRGNGACKCIYTFKREGFINRK